MEKERRKNKKWKIKENKKHPYKKINGRDLDENIRGNK